MEVSLFNEGDTLVTSIPPDILPEVVFEAIKRTNVLYGNMPYDKALERYMKTSVIPKLKPIEESDNE